MTWSREIKVEIAGIDVSSDAIDAVEVSMGAQTPWEQSVNGQARISLITESPDVQIGDQVVVSVESPDTPEATGGTVTTITDGGIRYRVHTFTTPGTHDFVVTSGGEVEYLIVAGGGGGGYGRGGGGGAGGLLTGSTSVAAGTAAITVGAGGDGANSGASATNGNDSVAFGLTAVGGGYGAEGIIANAGNGGSGGGGSRLGAGGSGTAGQGNDGAAGYTGSPVTNAAGGGGGGAGGVGGTADASSAGDGGAGVTSSISGSAVGYAGGGGGGIDKRGFTGTAGVGVDGGGSADADGGLGESGTNGTGGGGASGGISAATVLFDGGDGGDGIVIIRYRDTYQPVFTGTVANYGSLLFDFGPIWTIQATGPLTRAGRRNVTGTLGADTEGDRIASLAQLALAQQYRETPGTWADQALTWDGFAVDISQIDQPGLYDLAAVTETPVNVLDELAAAAFSGSGWLYETRDGVLGYGDSTRRENTPEADYLTIPGSAVDRSSWQSFTDEGNLVNIAEVIYDGGTATIDDATSLALYGRWERAYDTRLADVGDAIAFGARRLELDSAPRTNLAGPLIIDLLNTPDALTDALLAIERNYGVTIQEVPTYIAPEGVYRGFVEGYVWILNRIQPTLSLFVSDYSLSNFGLRWAAAGPTPWNGVGASLTWQDATEALA